MLISRIIEIAAAISICGLGLFVFARAPRGRVQQSFALLSATVGLWIVSVILVSNAKSEPVAARYAVLVFADSNLIPAFLAWFAAMFPRPRRSGVSVGLRIYICMGFLLAALAPTGQYAPLLLHTSGGWKPVNGPLSPVGTVYFFLGVAYFFRRILHRWRHSRGIERLQIQYLILGSFLSLSVSSLTNIVLPKFGDFRYTEIGPASTIFFVVFAGYAVARLHLLEITGVLRRGLAYGLTLIGLALIFMAAVLTLDRYFSNLLGARTVEAQAVFATVLAMGFQPAYLVLQRLVDRILYRDRYSYPRTLHTASRSLTTVLDLEHLRDRLTGSVRQAMGVDFASLVLNNGEEWVVQTEEKGAPLTVEGPLVRVMQLGQPVLREEAEIDRQGSVRNRSAAAMERLGADIAVPLLLHDELVGILLSGPKLSGGVYSDEDAELLSILANQAAVAVQNAQLYQEVKTSHRYVEAILDRMVSAVVTVQRDGSVVLANPAARRLLCDAEGTLKLPPTLRSVIERVFRTSEEITDAEFDIFGHDGEPMPVVSTVCPFMAESGSVDSALVVIRDISALRRLEDERVRADRLTAITRVAATLAHEIRNPLAAIKTFCQLLPEKYLDNEFREGFSQVALSEVERIDSLVSRLLAADRATRGAWEPVQLDEVLRGTVKLLQPVYDDHGVQLRVTAPAANYRVMGDADQLRQLYLNLLINARQASPRGACVRVVLEENDSGLLVTEIVNAGDPIPPAHLARLFEPFFTTRSSGTGLGLTVCRQVAEYHHGNIEVSSGDETVFRLILPPAEAQS